MTHASLHRPHIAWTLYFCVLFNVFVCGLGHGQMAGLELNGVGGQFCSAMGNPGPALDGDFSDQAAAGGLSTFMCPLCSAVSLGIALLFCLGWMLRRQRPPRLGGRAAQQGAAAFLLACAQSPGTSSGLTRSGDRHWRSRFLVLRH